MKPTRRKFMKTVAGVFAGLIAGKSIAEEKVKEFPNLKWGDPPFGKLDKSKHGAQEGVWKITSSNDAPMQPMRISGINEHDQHVDEVIWIEGEYPTPNKHIYKQLD